MRVLLSGMLVRHPYQGGATWAAAQWVLGLRALGHDVVVVEQLEGPATAEQTAYARTVEQQTGIAVALFAGESGGLADWTGIDVLAVRLAMIVATLVTGPIAILLYILTGWLATDDR